MGGLFDTLSRHPVRKKAYECASCLNRHHPKWAWFGLVWVALTDVYIRLCAMGVIVTMLPMPIFPSSVSVNSSARA